MEEKYELMRIRKEIFLAAYHGNCSEAHLASAFSLVEILYTLYCKDILVYRPAEPQWISRDRLVLSKGHASLALYTILAETGYFNKEILKSFCYPDSVLGGEPNKLEIPGVEATTGSLGHGLCYGIGIALGLKMDQSPAKTYVIIGDGECEEGSVWEGVMSAYRYELDNLTVIMDCNHLQKMNSVSATMRIDEWRTKWEAFGWSVEVVDGHNTEELKKILQKPKKEKVPQIIIAKTVKGKGVSIMEDNVQWHYKLPNRKELKAFICELGVSEEELKPCKGHI